MKFLSNIFDPTLPSTKANHTYSHHAISKGPEAMDNEWQQHLNWVNRNIRSNPKRTAWYTSEQLTNMGMIGIYALESFPKFYWISVTRSIGGTFQEVIDWAVKGSLVQKTHFVEVGHSDTLDSVIAKLQSVLTELYGKDCFKIDYHFGAIDGNSEYYPKPKDCELGLVYTDEHEWNTPAYFVLNS